jgi:hypothetical protein
VLSQTIISDALCIHRRARSAETNLFDLQASRNSRSFPVGQEVIRRISDEIIRENTMLDTTPNARLGAFLAKYDDVLAARIGI